MNDFDEEDVREALEELGVDISDAQLVAEFKRELDQLLEEEEDGFDEENISLFSSLNIDDDVSDARSSVFESPIRRTTTRKVRTPLSALQSAAAAREAYLPHIERLNFDTLSDYGSEAPHSSTEQLLRESARCIERMYDNCMQMDQKTAEIRGSTSQSLRRRSTPPEEQQDALPGQVPRPPTTAGGPINTARAALRRKSSLRGGSVSSGESEARTVTFAPDYTMPPDPSLRRIPCPRPGQPLMRHDPVTKHALYREEWQRMPAPGERKRLALRWKIRELMLHRDLPPVTLSSRVHHPKDWSPRPYLN